jgi:hypothetical protein
MPTLLTSQVSFLRLLPGREIFGDLALERLAREARGLDELGKVGVLCRCCRLLWWPWCGVSRGRERGREGGRVSESA